MKKLTITLTFLLLSIATLFAQFDATLFKTFRYSNVYDCDYSPLGNYFAICNDKSMELFDKKFTKQWSYNKKSDKVCFSSDEKFAAFSYGSRRNIAIIRLSDFKIIKKFKRQSMVQDIAFSPNGKFFASSHWNGKLKIYQINGNKFKKIATLYHGHARFSFSPDGKYLAVGASNHNMCIYEITDTHFFLISVHP